MTKAELLSRLHALTEWFEIFAGDLRDLAVELERARLLGPDDVNRIVCDRLAKAQRAARRDQATREPVDQATRPRST